MRTIRSVRSPKIPKTPPAADRHAKWRLLSKRGVSALVPYSKSSIERLVKLGLFPRPYKLSPGANGRVAWREEDVLMWIAAHVELPERNSQEVA